MDRGEKAGDAWLKKLMGANAPPASDILWAALGKLSFYAPIAYTGPLAALYERQHCTLPFFADKAIFG
jgi:hypothetical protein